MTFTLLLVGLAMGQGELEVPCDPNEPSAKSEQDSSGFLSKLLAETSVGACLDRHNIHIRGWTDASFTASSATRNQLPMGFNYEANQFLLQQNYLRIDRPINGNSAEASWGFCLDTILPGSDYSFTIARGLWDGQLTGNDGGVNRYGIDPVQFYLEGQIPGIAEGLNLKLGRFFAPIGVESIDATQNQLASRSYTFIYNPFTQTGLLTLLKLSENWSVQNGLLTGSDVFLDSASRPTYVGSLRWTSSDRRVRATFATILGSGRYDQSEAFHNPQVFDLVLSYQLDDHWTWTGEALYGFTNDVPGIGFANWYGVVNYLTVSLADNLSSTLRLEFFDDCQGQRTGFPGLYTAITSGIAYKPRPWLGLRPEVRLDHNDSRPFEGKPVLFTATMDVLLHW